MGLIKILLTFKHNIIYNYKVVFNTINKILSVKYQNKIIWYSKSLCCLLSIYSVRPLKKEFLMFSFRDLPVYIIYNIYIYVLHTQINNFRSLCCIPFMIINATFDFEYYINYFEYHVTPPFLINITSNIYEVHS